MSLAFMSAMSFMAAGVVDQILEVFGAIGDWFVTMITSMLPIFYAAETGLTILGVLACCGLAVGVIFLVIGFVQKFFHWRG